MFAFDVPTALMIIGLLYLLLPTITWVVLSGQRSTTVALWCGGGLLMGVAAILAGLVSRAPEWVAIDFSTLLFLTAAMMRIQSLRLDLGVPWRMRSIMLAATISFSVFLWLHYGLESPVLRAQFFSAASVVMLLDLAYQARKIGLDEKSRSAHWIAWVYLFVATASLFRVFYLIGFDPALVGFRGREGLASQLMAFGLLLSAVVGHLGYIGLHLDRSMRRELKTQADQVRNEERHRMCEQIAQLDRSRALGEMAASLGHELNQPLTATLTNAQVAKRGLQGGRFDNGQLTDFLDKIIHNTHRASQIIERIRNFIQPSPAIYAPVNLNQVISEVNQLVADEARNHQVRIEFNANQLPMLVTGDSIQLSQIILNVVRNAIDALTQVALRELWIECDCVDGRVILRVRDSGPGLKAETLPQVGTPFFTTKSAGLGMGLSISRSIAVQHGGTLTIANADSGGAVVELILPALPQIPS